MERDKSNDELTDEEIARLLQDEEREYWEQRERNKEERERDERDEKKKWDAWFMENLSDNYKKGQATAKELAWKYGLEDAAAADKQRKEAQDKARAYQEHLKDQERIARDQQLERARAKKGYLGNSNSHSLHVVGRRREAQWVPFRRKREEPDEFLQYAAGVFTADGMPVQPIKYQAKGADGGPSDQKVNLVLRCGRGVKLDKINIANLHIREQSGELKKFEAKQVGDDVICVVIKVRELLECIGGTPNSSVLLARALLSDGSHLDTDIPLHIVQQKLIVLLPGVLASSIHVDDHGSRYSAWLPPVATKLPMNQDAYMMYLECDDQGRPKYEACDLRFVTVFTDQDGPYYTKKWQGLLNRSLPFPTLRFGNVVLHYLLLQEYPYDWRYDAGDMMNILLGDVDHQHAEKEKLNDFIGHHNPKAWNVSGWSEIMTIHHFLEGSNPHARFKKMVSLKTVLRALKLWGNPFIDDEVAVAGHSTGGVLLNGLIRDPRAKGLIDGAFFIATPFLGALKSYTAFLTGEMDLPGAAEYTVFNRTAFVKMAPNMPVLYHLAPTKDYQKKIGTVVTEDGKVDYYVPDVREFLDIVIRALEDYRIDPKVRRRGWNTTLHDKAQNYQKTCDGDITIPKANIAIYYTDAGPTRGRLVIDLRPQVDPRDYPEDQFFHCGGGRFYNEKVKGDKTVPLESLLGPENLQDKLKKLSGGEDHVGICQSEEMWHHMASLLAHNLWNVQVPPLAKKEK